MTVPYGQSDQQLDDADARDALLAERLAVLTDRAARGEAIDLQREVDALGELGQELRELWAAVMLAHAVGSDATSHQTATSSPAIEPRAALTLPYHFADYRLIEEIGRGGMGVVYRAEQISLGRTVALKMLLRGQWASAVDLARFRAEAEAAARLDHPHIIPVYDVGEHDGNAFFSMKYVQGETLADRLKQGPLPAREIARIVYSVADAIEFAHSRGVLHRDLKPSNILLDDQDEAHVMDFGLAKQVTDANSLTRTGAVLGTPAYMAPEQASGNRGEVGVASDVYSLGTILYHMLTGQPPFTAATPMQIVLQVLEQDPPLPHDVNPRVDRDLEMVALRCLQKPPDLRYASAAALADDLDAYLKDEPLAAHSGRLSQVVARLFRETHHAVVLENWGLLWMWHSLALLVICFLTNAMYLMGNVNRVHYFLLWTAALGAWAGVFWALRRRMGPVTFVERQIAHVWAASMISIGLLFPVEYLLGLPVLKLSPILALSSGMVFLIKAGILSGTFYLQAAALFATAILMARWSEFSHILFGVVSAACFFFPGWKYYRQRAASIAR
ncbi:MAG: serine/threonine protein kinase [Planctomycetales bacterium]|nr:serine/threonine protein kinase [Planctomycetales bacterium]MCA9169609.1 serine/threonine protein kinase [Planctomycetales bacterium]